MNSVKNHHIQQGMFHRGWLAWMLSFTIALVFHALPAWASAHGEAAAASFTNKELVLNGEFSRSKSAWRLIGNYSDVRNNIGPDGGWALEMENISDNVAPRAYAGQVLHLPTHFTAGSFRFDYRLVQQSGGYAGGLTLDLVKGAGPGTWESLGQLYSSGWVLSTTDWQTITGTLTAEQVQAAQSAHEAGEPVWIVFTLHQLNSQPVEAPGQFHAIVDNVSLTASGSMSYPTGLGPIAFMGTGEDGYAQTVNLIEADGSGRKTVWTHPAPGTPRVIYDLAWKPDSTEIAFSSDHEGAYSAFDSDVYGIRPDGTHLRRITNPPSKAELDAGSYSTGTVTGKILNNQGNVGPFLIYIQGADKALSLDIGEWKDETPFTISDVADLGDNAQYMVFIWGGTGCREYTPTAVTVRPGEVTDMGTISFNGACGAYNSNHITWKGDGTELGVDIIAPRRFAAAGEAIGRDLFASSLTADKPSWSPVDDSLLYHEKGSSARGIYRTTVGGDAGNRLIAMGTGDFNVNMSWLPDGTGFVYTWGMELRQFLFDGNTDTVLFALDNEYPYNPSVSGDGKYVAFERQGSGVHSNIWVIQRTKLNRLWAVTEDGKSFNPDWAGTTIPTSLTVNIEPQAARDAGARWKRQGTTRWFASGEAETDPPTGTHTVEFTILPGWNTQESREVTLAAGQSVQMAATYTPNNATYQVQCTVSGQGGRVTGADTYQHNALVRLEATADKGYRFAHWKNSRGEVVSTNPVFQFRATEAQTFTAVFRRAGLTGILMLLLE